MEAPDTADSFTRDQGFVIDKGRCDEILYHRSTVPGTLLPTTPTLLEYLVGVSVVVEVVVVALLPSRISTSSGELSSKYGQYCESCTRGVARDNLSHHLEDHQLQFLNTSVQTFLCAFCFKTCVASTSY